MSLASIQAKINKRRKMLMKRKGMPIVILPSLQTLSKQDALTRDYVYESARMQKNLGAKFAKGGIRKRN